MMMAGYTFLTLFTALFACGTLFLPIYSLDCLYGISFR